MIYDLVPASDPILRQTMPRFDFSNPPCDPVELARNLVETMVEKGGLGLAANQCGLPYNVFVIRSIPAYACFNPRIVDTTSEKIKLSEGCLTYPGLELEIERARAIKIRFTLPNAETQTHTWNDLTARIAQHECDHLNGKVFLDYFTRLERDIAIRKMKKRKR